MLLTRNISEDYYQIQRAQSYMAHVGKKKASVIIRYGVELIGMEKAYLS